MTCSVHGACPSWSGAVPCVEPTPAGLRPTPYVASVGNEPSVDHGPAAEDTTYGVHPTCGV